MTKSPSAAYDACNCIFSVYYYHVTNNSNHVFNMVSSCVTFPVACSHTTVI